ncbi:candidapepsin-4 precursor [Beauveria brongniartii RCEF 3172]|uniref:Candidapepsin-4 n=1 Tax=Beauveria brongniartii RCEF 3172 TaxID=1081107 RepID=A0A166YN29_9HYPO|nr:candidapepsin-4 precursor [Beauveria brongniartii RCEF 3172]
MKSTCLNILFLAAGANAQSVVQASIQHFESKELGPAVPLIKLGLGTPAQDITGIFDTASSDIIVPEAAPFKPEAGADLQLLAGKSFNATLSRGEHFEGDYAKTTVSLGGVQVPNAQVGFASNIQTQANISEFAVVGVGLVAREATPDKYNNLPRILNVSGVTNSQTYSVVLNAAPLGNGSVFFGGIDRSKFTGELQQVPLVKDKAGQFSEFLVELSSIALVPAAAPAKVRRSTRQERREHIRRMSWHRKRQEFGFDGGEESLGFGPDEQLTGSGEELFVPGPGGLSPPVNGIQGPFQEDIFQGITDGITDGSTNGITDGITDGSTNGITDGITDGSTNGITDGITDGSTNGITDGITDGSTNGITDGITDGSTNGITDGITDGSTNGITDGITDGSTNGITDGITDGSTNGITDGITDGSTNDNQGITDGNNPSNSPVNNDGDKNKELPKNEDPSNSPVNSPVNNDDGKNKELPKQGAPTTTSTQELPKQGAPTTTSTQEAPKETPKQGTPKEAPKKEAPKKAPKKEAPKEAPKKEAPKKDGGGGQPAKLITSIDLKLDQRSAVTLMNTAGGVMALPAAVVAGMARALGTSFSATNGIGPVDCGRLGGGATLLMRFRNDTVEARVPLGNLRVSAELADPAIAQRGLCEVAVRPVPDGGAEPNVATLPFFAAMYTVFDLGNRSLWFAQARGDPAVPGGAQLEEFP